MPPLIGDCIMTFPLINHLKFQFKVTLVCNEYVFETIKILQNPLKAKLLSVDNLKDKIIIDFLSNEESALYIKISKPKLSVGFKDGYWNYDLELKQPSEFNSLSASSIFLYVLDVLGLDSNINIDFSCSRQWQFHNQQKILIAPSAGNISRCYSIEDFIKLGKKLGNNNVAFILGPGDKSILSSIPLDFEIIKTSSLKETIGILSKARMVIASEGGFMHIAASYGIPLIGLFKIASIKNWFPYENKYQIGIGDGINYYNNIPKIQMDIELVNETVEKIYESLEN